MKNKKTTEVIFPDLTKFVSFAGLNKNGNLVWAGEYFRHIFSPSQDKPTFIAPTFYEDYTFYAVVIPFAEEFTFKAETSLFIYDDKQQPKDASYLIVRSYLTTLDVSDNVTEAIVNAFNNIVFKGLPFIVDIYKLDFSNSRFIGDMRVFGPIQTLKEKLPELENGPVTRKMTNKNNNVFTFTAKNHTHLIIFVEKSNLNRYPVIVGFVPANIHAIEDTNNPFLTKIRFSCDVVASAHYDKFDVTLVYDNFFHEKEDAKEFNYRILSVFFPPNYSYEEDSKEDQEIAKKVQEDIKEEAKEIRAIIGENYFRQSPLFLSAFELFGINIRSGF